MIGRVLSSACLVLAACAESNPGNAPPDAVPDGPGVDADGNTGPDPVTPDAAAARVRKLLMIGVDGVRHDKLALVNIPAMRALAERGIMARTWVSASPMAGTWSGPGWSTIATGVWPDKHRVLDNNFRGNDLASYPDFLTRLERDRPVETYVIASWLPLTTAPGPVFGAALDERVMHDGYQEDSWAAADARITREASEHLRTRDPDAAFVYLGNVDIVGHAGDTDLRYLAAIETTDQQIGELVAAIEARPTYDAESWLVIVTTDHGHRDGGQHGGNSWQERQSFVIAAGGDIPATTLAFEPRIVDIAPTVLAHFGVAIDPAWQLDGVALGAAPTDAFDGVALRTAVDERAVPGLGWSPEPPAGWSIDNSRMQPGGVTEWRGWSFATPEFWNLTDPNQGRESFVRSRGVIAIADPDEWNDIGSPADDGTFDSTLSSPPFAVTAGTAVRLGFSSHYQQEGRQRGHVLIPFDGGLAQPYLRYGPDSGDSNHGQHVISRREVVPIQVPPGARQMVVHWRLFDAGNNWYWAIDDPRVDPAP